MADGGKLSRAEILRCKVRHFSDGVVLGSKGFVDAFFKNLKSAAQSQSNYQGQYEKRETGARKLKHLNKKDALFSMRDLR